MWLKCDAGTWQATGAGTLGTDGGFCPINGAVGTTATGQQLICEGNTWITLTARMGKLAVFMVYRASDGQFIPEPPCGASGTPRIFATPQIIDAQNLYANVTTGGWIVRIRDGADAVLSGNVLAQSACWYP